MIEVIGPLNKIAGVLIVLLFGYQFIYMIESFIVTLKRLPNRKNHRYAVIIPARNERNVITQLIDSIKRQSYPSELVDVFVCADNCTDDTAGLAHEAGAVVYRRENEFERGKGYALNFVFNRIFTEYGEDHYDGYLVLDADNLIDADFISEMNRVFNAGYKVVTSYRNSKNFDSNWISAGYSIWFMRESAYLNKPRMYNGSSCMISGTGFLVHKEIIKRNRGWKHHLLTEDLEFSVDTILSGERIGYADNAILYDEQPTEFAQSWHQRLRWIRGVYQIFGKYGRSMIAAIFRGRGFSNYDALICTSPTLLLSMLSVFFNAAVLLYATIDGNHPLWQESAHHFFSSVGSYYLIMFIFATITTVSEWKKIHAPVYKKLFYTLTFPIFIFTYVPISIAAMFKKIEWKPIKHKIVKTVEDFDKK